MVNSSGSQDAPYRDEPSQITVHDEDISQALSLNALSSNIRWVSFASSLYWAERNPVLVMLLFGSSWACGQLCNYFGIIVLLSGFAMIYSKANAPEEHSQETQ